MKAAIKMKKGPGNLEVVETDDPKITSEELLVEVKAAGVCGTDISMYDWTPTITQGYNPPLPLIMGHEFSGMVAEVGKGTKGFSVGDRVTANPIVRCGHCFFCQTGKFNICNNRATLGFRRQGVFAKYVSIPYANAYKLSDQVSYELGALTEPLCVAIRATERVSPECGDTVVIVGAGPIGLLLSLLVKLMGAAHVIVTGLRVDEMRLEVARKVGMETINVDEEDPGERILELTHGLGADIVLETAGHPTAVLQSLKLVRRGGRVGLVGLPHAPTNVDTATLLVLREVDLIAVLPPSLIGWQRSQQILTKLNPELLITHILPLEEAVRGINLVKERKAIKVLLKP